MVDDWLNETPGGWDGADQVERRAVARKVSEIEPVSVRWLWHHRIPYGMLSEVCGDPGEGKSHLTLAVATAETLGLPLPGDPEGGARVPGHVLLVCMEDSPEATVRPRLEGMGADLTRVTILDGFRGEHGEPDPLDLSRVDHRIELRRLMEELGVTLVVIDPITAHLGGANEWKDSEVRSILAPLSQLADGTGAAILLVRHLRKSDSSRAIYRAGGSIAFTASVRSSLLIGRPNGEERQRAIVRMKGNLSSEPPSVGFVLDENGWDWTDAGEWTAADLLGGDTTSEERSRREEAADFLVAALANGPRKAKEIRRVAEAEGLSWRTVQRTRRELGIGITREGFPATSMWHPSGLDTDDVDTESRQSRQVPVAPLEERKSGATEEDQAGEQVSGVQECQSRQSPLYGISGATGGISDNGEPPASCDDCGKPVPPDPAFEVLRCVPCGIRAGKEVRHHA